jgi:hypothetical protein
MVQLAGGVTVAQFKTMTVEENAVALSPMGAEGTALQLAFVTVSKAVLLVTEPDVLVTTTL